MHELGFYTVKFIHMEYNMTDKSIQAQADHSNMEKNPDDWVTGDEAMTGAQASYLKTLSEEAKEDFNEGLTKAQASKRIEELQAKTGRGAPAH
jgi:hydroxypyruvate isomerase